MTEQTSPENKVRKVVEVLRSNDIEVCYPEQKCCGMPPLLEGDRQLTLEMAGANIERLAETVAAGYDVVCSCPTCGFMLKHILKDGAY
jgi:glycerol-3-phosphate dehydrogenase subunit C